LNKKESYSFIPAKPLKDITNSSKNINKDMENAIISAKKYKLSTQKIIDKSIVKSKRIHSNSIIENSNIPSKP